MDGLLRLIDLVSQPPPDYNSKAKSVRAEDQPTNNSNQNYFTETPNTTPTPTVTLQIKYDNSGQLNGLHIHASNVSSGSKDPNEKLNPREVGLNADVTGPIQAHISGKVEESLSGFQADLDFTISEKENSNCPPKCAWSGYDTNESQPFNFGDILNNFFPPKQTFSPKNKQPPTLVGMMENIAKQYIKPDTSEEDKSKIDFNNDDDFVIYENKIVYQEEHIHGTYHTDVDIIRIDELINKKLLLEIAGLGQKEKQMILLTNQLNSSVRRSEAVCIRKDLSELAAEIDQIRTKQKLFKYQSLSDNLLKSYQEIGRYIQIINFGETAKIGNVDSNRLRIIMEYLGIARKYIKINLIHIEKSNQDCQVCSTDLANVYPDDTGMIKCPGCQVETHYLQPTQQENYTVNNTGKSNYKDKETFVKGISRYEGKQKVSFPSDLLDSLDSFFESKGYPSRKNSPNIELVGTVEGRRKRKGTSREMMMTALRETLFSGHYEDCNLLSNLIWGSELPDLTTIRDRILRDYDLSQQVFNRVKGSRKSSLGADYRLFRHLWHLGFPCHPSDFKIVTTPAIIKYYEEVWEKVCIEIGMTLGWKPFRRIEVLCKIDKDTLRLPIHFT
uniref:Late transcription factor 3-like protein n=1 Tax=Pithovirus LCPAC202 TaxID=2506592 RepID=A0A481Z8Z2_9VIRU|nr:MAG: late transcription factor 3-like protein [Pithovirus LCPAC202]